MFEAYDLLEDMFSVYKPDTKFVYDKAKFQEFFFDQKMNGIDVFDKIHFYPRFGQYVSVDLDCAFSELKSSGVLGWYTNSSTYFTRINLLNREVCPKVRELSDLFIERFGTNDF